MPIDLKSECTSVLTLDEFVEQFATLDADPEDDESLIQAADLLRGLSNNKEFLSDYLISLLRPDKAYQTPQHDSTSQVFKICELPRRHYLRAVVWPSASDSIYRQHGSAHFYYEEPHDHNFHFLTINHFGPGYESDYYEAIGSTDDWHPGAEVELKSVGRKRLAPDKLMLYRAFVDVHSQFPPESASITLNIMASRAAVLTRKQHIFDKEVRVVKRLVHHNLNPLLFHAAATIGPSDFQEKLMYLYRTGDSDLLRFHALRAAAVAEQSEDGEIDVLALGLEAPSEFISGWTRVVLKELDARRDRTNRALQGQQGGVSL
jgi:hypothetical protein